MDTEKYTTLKKEVAKLKENNIIKESLYPDWLVNPAFVTKPNCKWRTYIDFTNLYKPYPKDNFPLPRIDQLVDATTRHELLTSMDAYSGYNQIPMYTPYKKHTSFITDRGLYCYRVTPFGLINTRAIYHSVVNSMFENQIGRIMEVYVDDMLVKSRKVDDHVKNLE